MPHAIIFDLGNVLLTPSKVAFVQSVGLSTIAQYSLYQNPIHLESDFMAFLHSIQPINVRYPSWHNDSNLLPQIMTDWLSGTRSSADSIQLIEKASETVACSATRALFCAIAHTMFDPKDFINSIIINQDGIDFVRSCKTQGHQVYILSNWDPESFDYFTNQHPQFIELFDGIVISGDIGHVKPDPFIYEYLLTRYKIDPKDALFIDDIVHNTTIAEQLDIFGIQCKQKSGFSGTYPYFPYVRDMFALWTDAQKRSLPQLLRLT